jgi:hypothetical protein
VIWKQQLHGDTEAFSTASQTLSAGIRIQFNKSLFRIAARSERRAAVTPCLRGESLWSRPSEASLRSAPRGSFSCGLPRSGRASRFLSTLIERSKNVRKRKIRKVDRSFRSVTRGSNLHFFVCQARSSKGVRRAARESRAGDSRQERGKDEGAGKNVLSGCRRFRRVDGGDRASDRNRPGEAGRKQGGVRARGKVEPADT